MEICGSQFQTTFFLPKPHSIQACFLYFLKIILFSFWLRWSALLLRLFLQLQQIGITLQLRCVGFSFWWLILLQSMDSGAQQLQLPGSAAQVSGCGSWVQLFCGMWNLPRLGIEAVSPALAGKLFTTEPPEKLSGFQFSILLSPLNNGHLDSSQLWSSQSLLQWHLATHP